jgi:hypothetical protein
VLPGKVLLAVIAFVLSCGGTIEVALGAISLSDFDAVDPERQAKVLGAVVNAYFRHYKENSQTAAVAACMERLYQPVAGAKIPPLVDAILDDLRLARADESRNYTIEQIVEGVIRRDCAGAFK